MIDRNQTQNAVFKPIGLEDRDIIRSYTAGLGISYYSFVTLYTWRETFRHSYAIIDGALCITGTPVGDERPICFFPLGEREDDCYLSRIMAGYFPSNDFMPLTADMAACIDRAMPGMYETVRCENYDDYVYNTEDLITLRGKKYHAKRNHINKFMQRYGGFEYIPMTAQNAHLCLGVESDWLESKGEADDMMLMERHVIGELISNFDALGLRGAMIAVEGKIIAFSIGELLRSDMAHILIEKADVSYDGAFSLINREFVAREWSETKFINREEDMGEEGLRKAKRSYYPAYMNEIYMLRRAIV